MKRIVRFHRVGIMAPVLLLLILGGPVVGSGPARVGAAPDNNAAAFGWGGFVDTDLQFSEFFNNPHTLVLRFMLQYPLAYEAPLVVQNGSGTYLLGKSDAQGALSLAVGGSPQVFTHSTAGTSYLAAGVWQHLAVVRTNTTPGGQASNTSMQGPVLLNGTTPLVAPVLVNDGFNRVVHRVDLGSLAAGRHAVNLSWRVSDQGCYRNTTNTVDHEKVGVTGHLEYSRISVLVNCNAPTTG